MNILSQFPRKGKKKEIKPKIVFVLDSSGSCYSDNILKAYFNELHDIYKELKVEFLVIVCDMQINQTFTYKEKLKYTAKELMGGGGTSFVPPFEYLEKHKIHPDGLIYLTDLEGPFPNKPKYPVLWVSLVKGNKAPFGKTIYLDV